MVRWERVRKYLAELGVPTCGDDSFIPENIFYRLAMKSKNEVAEKFQAMKIKCRPGATNTGTAYIEAQPATVTY